MSIKRFTELKEYTAKGFEVLESEVEELRKEVNDIKAKITTIESRLNNI